MLLPAEGHFQAVRAIPTEHRSEGSSAREDARRLLTSPPRYAKEIAMNVNWEGKEYVFEKPMLVSRLLEKLEVSKEGHLVVANNRLVTEDHRLGADDIVRVIRVVSGG